jgi:hypothetical protein
MMLPLDSSRWMSFRTFFGTPKQVPQMLGTWQRSIGSHDESIGSHDESSRWSDLWELFLHQCTITDAAYAAFPHVVFQLNRVEPRKRFDYLVELALIESARQNDADAPELAADLTDAYHASVVPARRFAIELLSLEWPNIEFRYVTGIVATLHGHGMLGDLIFNMDSLCANCPKCGEYVYPEQIQQSGYVT